MDSDKLKKMFEDCDNDYLKFDKIPKDQRLHSSKVLCSYLKIVSLMKKPEDFEVHGEHDIIYLCQADGLVDLTTEDVLYLTRCGIHYNTECSCLADFC